MWHCCSRLIATTLEFSLFVSSRLREAVRHGSFTFCIRVPRRDDLAAHLLEAGIYTTLRYHPLHLNGLYGQTNQRLKNCERLNEEALSIPLHPRLTDDDVAKVIRTIQQFYHRGSAAAGS